MLISLMYLERLWSYDLSKVAPVENSRPLKGRPKDPNDGLPVGPNPKIRVSLESSHQGLSVGANFVDVPRKAWELRPVKGHLPQRRSKMVSLSLFFSLSLSLSLSLFDSVFLSFCRFNLPPPRLIPPPMSWRGPLIFIDWLIYSFIHLIHPLPK